MIVGLFMTALSLEVLHN